MRPAGRTRCWRKSQRRAWRGMPAGRRDTHPVKTAYGRGQARRDWLTTWDAVRIPPNDT